MSIRLDISRGIDPVPVYSDIVNDNYTVWEDGVRYIFDRLPFTLKEVGKHHCVDRSILKKHLAKARKARDLRTAESLPNA